MVNPWIVTSQISIFKYVQPLYVEDAKRLWLCEKLTFFVEIQTICEHKLPISKFFIYQLMNKRTVFKRMLQFTLKQLLHVSVQSPSSGSALFELAKVTVVKIID
jgi:hypothetical protein